ncbi:MAG: protein of unknown function [Nitrospira sp.]
MILILADTADPWSTLLHRELFGRGQEVSWIRPEQLLDRILLNWPVTSGSPIPKGRLVIDGVPVALADLTGMFIRFALPPPLELDGLSLQDRGYVAKETSAAWLGLLNAIPCSVVNRPVPGGRPTLLAGSPCLSRLATECGFTLPPSRTTSNRTDAIMQFAAWSEQVFLKPLASQEPGITLQAQDGVEQIYKAMERQAVSLQAIPHGQRMTVYVVGEKAVATIVQADQSPGANPSMASLATRQCVDLVRALGLAFAECQLVVTSDRTMCCLDVSGAPSYWRCPQAVQRQLVGRLADLLSEPRSIPIHDSFDGADGGSCAGERVCQTGSPER